MIDERCLAKFTGLQGIQIWMLYTLCEKFAQCIVMIRYQTLYEMKPSIEQKLINIIAMYCSLCNVDFLSFTITFAYFKITNSIIVVIFFLLLYILFQWISNNLPLGQFVRWPFKFFCSTYVTDVISFYFFCYRVRW